MKSLSPTDLFVAYLKRNSREYPGMGPITLVEMQDNKSAQIAHSVFLSALNVENLVGYFPYFTISKFKIFLYKVTIKFEFLHREAWPFRIYKALGANRFIFVDRYRLVKRHRAEILGQFLTMSKQDVLNFQYCGIRVGDLFYDWFLRTSMCPTINTRDKVCQTKFVEFLEGVDYWNNYFTNNEIGSVLVTHSVYEQGVPARFAIARNIPVYLVTSEKCFRLNKIDYLSDLEFKYYDPNSPTFNGFEIDLREAESKLNTLFSGEIGVDVAHSFVSGFAGSETEKIIRNNSKVRILIAAHCFSDSPHANGDHIFSDFLEWLKFLSEYAIDSNYEWYIKAHPAFFTSDIEIFREFCLSNPHITPIGSNYSNAELIKQGINVVLTVYGTIAFEAAYLGALVVDASKNTPHMNYDFTVKPESAQQYLSTLNNLESLVQNYRPNKDEILHFYGTHHLRKSTQWLFRNTYNEMVEFMGGFSSQYFDPKIFLFWITLCEDESHRNQVLKSLVDFIREERYAF